MPKVHPEAACEDGSGKTQQVDTGGALRPQPYICHNDSGHNYIGRNCMEQVDPGAALVRLRKAAFAVSVRLVYVRLHMYVRVHG